MTDQYLPAAVSGDQVHVVFDGCLTEPQLDHPEGIAVHRDGSIWCGGERGQIYRLPPDGSSLEQVGSTGGFCLGMAFDAEDNLFICDQKHAAVMRFDTAAGKTDRWADGGCASRTSRPSTPQDGCMCPTATPSAGLARVCSASNRTASANSGTART